MITQAGADHAAGHHNRSPSSRETIRNAKGYFGAFELVIDDYAGTPPLLARDNLDLRNFPAMARPSRCDPRS